MSKGQSTREMIIEKSVVLFNTKGFEGCSMSDIMFATGLKKGGIYNHFINKDEIAEEAFKHSIKLLENKLRKVASGKDTDKERLIAILEFYRIYVNEPVIKGGCPILNTVVDADGTKPNLISLAKENTKRIFKLLEGLIVRGQKNGEFNSDIEARAVSLNIFSGLQGALLLNVIVPEEEPMNILIDSFLVYLNQELFLNE